MPLSWWVVKDAVDVLLAASEELFECLLVFDAIAAEMAKCPVMGGLGLALPRVCIRLP